MQKIKCVIVSIISLSLASVALILFVSAKTVKIAPEKGEVLATSTSVELSPEQVRNYVALEAKKAGVNPNLALCIISHESQGDPSKSGKDTGNTISRGLWQWNNYWHKEITDKCAYDVVCSTEKALAWILNGHIRQWSTYGRYCDNLRVMEIDDKIVL